MPNLVTPQGRALLGRLAGAGDPAAAQLANMVTSFWTMDETSGNRADSKGGNTLVPTGTPGNAAGVNGNSAVISSGNYFTVASNAALQTGNVSFFIAVRVYPTALSNGIIIAKGSSASTASIEFGLSYRTDTFFQLDIWQAGSVQSVTSTFPATAPQWIDVIAWVDVVANTLNIEVNGFLTSVTKTKTPSITSSAIGVGAYNNGTNQFIGRIDDLCFGKGAPTAAQRMAFRRKTYPFNVGQGIYEIGQLGTRQGVFLSPNATENFIPVNAVLSGVLVMYFHGSNEGETAWASDPLKAGIRDALLAKNHVLSVSAANGNNWGNDAGLTAFLTEYNDLITRYPSLTKVVLLSQSMGGMAGLLSLAAGNIPAKGWYGIYPVCSMANLFANNTGAYAPDIRAAYSLAADGSDYSTKTVGHDPYLLSGSAFTGKRMRFTASPGDTVVNKAANADAMSALVAGYALENTVIATTGNHGDPSNFMPSDVSAFVDRCVA